MLQLFYVIRLLNDVAMTFVTDVVLNISVICFMKSFMLFMKLNLLALLIGLSIHAVVKWLDRLKESRS